MTAAVALQAAPDQRMATAVAVLLITSVLLGGCWAAMGRLRWGRLVRFVPYPVIGGFLAAVGWLMFRGGFSVASGRPVDLSMAVDLVLHGPSARQWVALVVSVGLVGLTLRLRHALTTPTALAVSIAAVLAGLSLAGIDEQQARAGGWLMPRFADLHPPVPWNAALWSAVDWGVVVGQAGTMVTVVIVGTIALLLSHSSLEVAFNTDGDMDRDLQELGWGHLAVAASGGLLGGISVGRSLANREAGGRTRWSVAASGVTYLLIALFGASMVAWLPLPVLGALSMYLGLLMLKTWLVDAMARMSRNDRAVVVLMVLLTMAFGYLPAVLAGVVICCFDFALSQSQLGPVRRQLNARDWPAPVERHPAEQAWLDQPGDDMRIVELQGTLFFGSVQALLRDLAAWTRAGASTLLLDFRHVGGVDSSAVQALARLRTAARTAGVGVAFSGLDPAVRRSFQVSGQIPADTVYASISDAVLAWGDRRLQLRTMVPPDPVHAWLAEELGSAGPVERLLPHLDRVELAPGDRLFAEGEAADSLYFIASGRLSVQVHTPRGPLEVKVLQAGVTVGEMGVYRGAARAATVVATAPSVVWRLSQDRLLLLEREAPDLAVALHRLFVRLLAERLAHANAHARALSS